MPLTNGQIALHMPAGEGQGEIVDIGLESAGSNFADSTKPQIAMLFAVVHRRYAVVSLM